MILYLPIRPGLLNALRRCDTLDRIYRLRDHQPAIHCGDETCTDDHG